MIIVQCMVQNKTKLIDCYVAILQRHQHFYIKVKVKVKFTLEHAIKTQMGSRDMVLLFL